MERELRLSLSLSLREKQKGGISTNINEADPARLAGYADKTYKVRSIVEVASVVVLFWLHGQ